MLKKIRTEKGYTQSEVAKKAKISERAYQNYELGERIPNVQIAQQIANVLHTTVEELFPLSSKKVN